MVEHKGHLVGDRILVDRHRHAAQRLRRRNRPIEPRPVVADDRELVAAPESVCGQAAGQRLDLGRDLEPAPALPDAVILFAIGRPVRPPPCMFEQQFRKRIRRAARLGRFVLFVAYESACSHRCFSGGMRVRRIQHA